MQCWPPGRKFPCSLRERYKFQTLFRNFPILILFEMILWTRGMQWLQPHRRGFDGRAKNFLSVYKNVKKHINRKIDLHKNPIVPANAVLTTPPKLSLQSREGYKFNTFSGNPFFISPHSDPMDTKDALTTTWPKSYRQKAEIVSLNLQKVWRQHKNQKSDRHKVPFVSVHATLTTPPKLSLQSPRRI